MLKLNIPFVSTTVSIETGQQAGWRGSVPGGSSDGIFFINRAQTSFGTRSSFCRMGTGGKAAGREAHSPPSSGGYNVWSYTSTPSIRLHSVVLN